MAKQAVVPEVKKKKQEMVTEAVKELGGGKESSVANVQAWLKAHYPKEDFPSIQGQVSKARKDLGFGRGSGGSGGSGGDSGEPTLSDLRNAKELADKHSMSPTQLAELVGEISEFGDLGSLGKCLTALVDFTTAKK